MSTPKPRVCEGDSSDYSSHTSSGTDSDLEESSSDWDVTSSDNESSDATTLDPFGYSRSSPSQSSFSNIHSIEGELSNYDSHHTNDTNNNKMPYLLKMTTVHHNEPEVETEAIFDLQIDLGYYLYDLFYPYTNYQALLFSQPNLYTKIKKKKNFRLYEEEIEEEEEVVSNTVMDWNNISHIERISGLLERLLRTAGSKGIEEISIYQMFSSPSPQRIIYELRFGLYTNLCIIHLDPFGRRTFYYYTNDRSEDDNTHFFNDNLLTQTNIFNDANMNELSDFIKDENNIVSRIQNSQTQVIKDERNVAKTPIVTPIKVSNNVTKPNKKKPKQRSQKKKPNNIASRSANSSPRNHHRRRSKKKKIVSKETSNNKKPKKQNTLRFENYAITTLFKRRLSARDQSLLENLKEANGSNTKNIGFRYHKKQKHHKRRRKYTIEDMGNGKWCTIQLNHQFLVSGFIRNIAKLLPLFLTVPLSIVKLVGMFYYMSSHLLLISGSMECRNTKHNQLHILGISNKKRYKIKLNRFRNDIRKSSTPTPRPTRTKSNNNNKKLNKTKLKNSKSNLSSSNNKKKNGVTTRKKSSRTMSLKFRRDAYNSSNNNRSMGHVSTRNAMDEKRLSNTNKKISNKIKRSNKDVSLSQKFDRYGLGNCFQTSLSLPQWPWLKQKFIEYNIPIHTKGKYCVIIRSGGTYTWNETVSKENDIIVFNSKHLYHTHNKKSKGKENIKLHKSKKHKKHKHHRHHHRHKYLSYSKPKVINGYYCRIPSFKKEIEYLSVIYNEYNNKLFSFGGLNLGRCNKSILEMALNCNRYKNLKWKKCSTLKKQRYSCSLINCGYYQNKIGIIGGLNNNSKEMRHCELYNIQSKETISIASLNEGRSNCGIYHIEDINQGTIVCGGGVKYGDGSKQIELYNFHKNTWTIHNAITNYKHSFPTIWNDQINPNIIYIGGDNIGISGGGRNANLGFIEWCDLRDCTKKLFNVLYEDSIDRLWRFKFLSRHHNNQWESRALFCM